MMSASFYGFIGNVAQKIMPSVWWKPELGSFVAITFSGPDCNDLTLHLTQEQAQKLVDGILKVVEERAECPVKVEVLAQSDEEIF